MKKKKGDPLCQSRPGDISVSADVFSSANAFIRDYIYSRALLINIQKEYFLPTELRGVYDKNYNYGNNIIFSIL